MDYLSFYTYKIVPRENKIDCFCTLVFDHCSTNLFRYSLLHTGKFEFRKNSVFTITPELRRLMKCSKELLLAYVHVNRYCKCEV